MFGHFQLIYQHFNLSINHFSFLLFALFWLSTWTIGLFFDLWHVMNDMLLLSLLCGCLWFTYLTLQLDNFLSLGQWRKNNLLHILVNWPQDLTLLFNLLLLFLTKNSLISSQDKLDQLFMLFYILASCLVTIDPVVWENFLT